MSDRRAIGLLTLLLLVITLPFVRRAYFVDDFYFVTMAKGILEHPARPYDFVSDDDGIANPGWERGKQPRMVNPPLFHYYLAAVIAVWGDAVWKLRTASLVFPLFSLYAVYFLGKRFVRDSFAAASLLAITPAFWLTSYSLLLDSALLAFFLASLLLFIRGHEQRRSGLLMASGVLMGMALLTKYTGFLIFPVVLTWHLLNRERCSLSGTLLSIGVCAAMFLLWGIWGIATYGQMHFTATLSRGLHPTAPLGLVCLLLFIAGCFIRWSVNTIRKAALGSWACWTPCLMIAAYSLMKGGSLGSWLQMFYLDKTIAVSSFLGGCTVFLFFAPYLLWKYNRRYAAGLAAAAILLFVCFSSRYGGFDRVQSGHLAFFIASSLGFLVLLGLKSSMASERSWHFLIAWFVLGLLELVVVMPWTAGRYLLLVLPPACWLFRGMMESSGRTVLWNTALGTTALMGLALAYVDFAQAQVMLPLAQALDMQQALFQRLSPRPAHHWYNLADTFDGSEPYVKPLGWENSFPFQDFPSGSLLLRRVYRKSSWWTIKDMQRFRPLMGWEFDSRIPLRVMDVPASAGFYASCWGSLPYVFTRHPLERFELYAVK